MVNPKDDLAFLRVVNVPPRGLGKTSIEHLSTAARERACRCWPWRGEPGPSPALKEKAAAASTTSPGSIDELSALRDRLGRGSHPPAARPDRLSRAPRGRAQAATARNGWRTSTS